MNILSLFDGMSCLQIALNRLKIKYNSYYASEIDKHAIRVTQTNYPNTIQLGDIRNVHAKDLPRIDFIAGGSPCQGFSFAGKGLNFEDPRSKLFFEFVRLVKEVMEINPDAKFLLENVQMKKEHEIIISRYMGVNPIVINSALVSAQNRVRLYWTNINNKPYGMFGDMFTDIPQPKDKGILLKHILESDVDEKYFLSEKSVAKLVQYRERERERGNGFTSKFHEEEMKMSALKVGGGGADDLVKINKKGGIKENQEKASCFTAGGNSSGNHSDIDLICVAMRGRGENNEQTLEENNAGKTNCLTSVQKDNLVMCINSKNADGSQTQQQDRIFDIDGKMTCLGSQLGGRFNIEIPGEVGAIKTGRTEEGKKNRKISMQKGKDYSSFREREIIGLDFEKMNTITASRSVDNLLQIVNTFRIRRLRPIECERLQTVPDNYTAHVSDSQRYKMLGNGWNVDTICHILSYLK